MLTKWRWYGLLMVSRLESVKKMYCFLHMCYIILCFSKLLYARRPDIYGKWFLQHRSYFFNWYDTADQKKSESDRKLQVSCINFSCSYLKTRGLIQQYQSILDEKMYCFRWEGKFRQTKKKTMEGGIKGILWHLRKYTYSLSCQMLDKKTLMSVQLCVA